MRVVFRHLNHWQQEHEMDTWPDRDDVVELKDGTEDRFYKVSGTKWVLFTDNTVPCLVIDLVPAHLGRGF